MTRQITHSFVKALRGVPDFTPLDDQTLLRICGAAASLFWPAGGLVFEEGSPGDALYIVMSGAISIFDVDARGTESEVARLGQGGYFGDLSLLRNSKHSKGARAVEDTELMVVPKQSFEALLASDTQLEGYFRRLFEERASTFTDGADASAPRA